MSFMDSLEDRFGSLAVRGLIKYLAAAQTLVFFLGPMYPRLQSALVLDPVLVSQGEYWRVLTFLTVPLVSSPFWLVFYVLALLSFGASMEAAWGSFRFNAFFWTGVAGSVAGAFIYPDLSRNCFYLIESLFLAFAVTFPDASLLIFFIIPVRAKWLGLAGGAVLVYTFLLGDWPLRLALLVSLANFVLFVGLGWFRRGARRAASAAGAVLTRPRAVHACATCKATELKDPDLEFRYCSDCDKEYCLAHLENHPHE